MSNILIIKHGSLGDIAQACGAIQDIFENHKDDKLYMLTTKPYVDLFKKNPFISDVILDKRVSRFNLSPSVVKKMHISRQLYKIFSKICVFFTLSFFIFNYPQF